MTSSVTQDFLSSVANTSRIPADKLAYFQTRLAARIHQAILKIFGRLERESGLTRKVLARRIGRSPEQITRWFSYPGNLTLATASDIFIGMGYELESVALVSVATGDRIDCTENQTDWIQQAKAYQKQLEPSARASYDHKQQLAANQQSLRAREAAESSWTESRRSGRAVSEFVAPFAGSGIAEMAQLMSGERARQFN
jgi:hypothetical protein